MSNEKESATTPSDDVASIEIDASLYRRLLQDQVAKSILLKASIIITLISGGLIALGKYYVDNEVRNAAQDAASDELHSRAQEYVANILVSTKPFMESVDKGVDNYMEKEGKQKLSLKIDGIANKQFQDFAPKVDSNINTTIETAINKAKFQERAEAAVSQAVETVKSKVAGFVTAEVNAQMAGRNFQNLVNSAMSDPEVMKVVSAQISEYINVRKQFAEISIKILEDPVVSDQAKYIATLSLPEESIKTDPMIRKVLIDFLKSNKPLLAEGALTRFQFGETDTDAATDMESLLKILADSSNEERDSDDFSPFNIDRSYSIALARCRPAVSEPILVNWLHRNKAHPKQVVVAQALGRLGTETGIKMLWGMKDESKDERKWAAWRGLSAFPFGRQELDFCITWGEKIVLAPPPPPTASRNYYDEHESSLEGSQALSPKIVAIATVLQGRLPLFKQFMHDSKLVAHREVLLSAWLRVIISSSPAEKGPYADYGIEALLACNDVVIDGQNLLRYALRYCSGESINNVWAVVEDKYSSWPSSRPLTGIRPWRNSDDFDDFDDSDEHWNSTSLMARLIAKKIAFDKAGFISFITNRTVLKSKNPKFDQDLILALSTTDSSVMLDYSDYIKSYFSVDQLINSESRRSVINSIVFLRKHPERDKIASLFGRPLLEFLGNLGEASLNDNDISDADLERFAKATSRVMQSLLDSSSGSELYKATSQKLDAALARMKLSQPTPETTTNAAGVKKRTAASILADILLVASLNSSARTEANDQTLDHTCRYLSLCATKTELKGILAILRRWNAKITSDSEEASDAVPSLGGRESAHDVAKAAIEWIQSKRQKIKQMTKTLSNDELYEP